GFVVLRALPLTAHGKVDRRALPPPERSADAALHVPPRTAAELALARIWQDVLRRARVGIHDDFFASGGDSILSIQIVARARQVGLHFAPIDVFRHPTIGALAAIARTSPTVDAEQGPVSGPVVTTPIQRWFLAQALPTHDHWNQTLLLRVPSGIDTTALGRALEAIVTHHDALRLRLTAGAAGWRQAIAEPGVAVPLEVVDLSTLPPAGRP